MKWIDSIPPLAPLTETLDEDQVRLYYRGAEPIKAFAIYTVSSGNVEGRDEADLAQVLVADRTLDISLSKVPSLSGDKIFVSSIDLNNNVSDWVQLR
jgi:hypothetical protein